MYTLTATEIAKEKQWEVRMPRPAAAPAYTIVDGNGHYVAHVEIHAHNHAMEAARLIAAAPEMLAELIYIRECVETNGIVPMGRTIALIHRATGSAA